MNAMKNGKSAIGGRDPGAGASVLILADGEDARSYESLVLKGEHIGVCALKDGLERLSDQKADIVLLDCGHRVWTGLSTMKELKERHPHVPVVFLTAESSEDAAINAYKLGAREYFRKPVNIFEIKLCLQRLLEFKRRADRKNSEEAARSAPETAAFARAVTTDKPRNILEVVTFIEQNLRSSLELENLAKRAHLSKYHFCRVFKQHIGMNPMKFVNALRIERAKEYLRRSDYTVSMVADEVGFRDLSNFIRQFKKRTGVTPTDYRDRKKNPDGAGILSEKEPFLNHP